jgi:beta-glucosidase
MVAVLAVQELVQQMAMGGGGTGQPVPGVPRLGIPAYQFDTECLHGVMTVPVTSFPQSIGLSASFRFVCIQIMFIFS